MASSSRTYAGGPGARYVLLGAAYFLTALGLVMIYSASSITASIRDGSSLHYLERQLLFVAASSAVAWFLSRYDYRRLKDHAQPLWWASIGLLVATFVVGIAAGGARRWIPIGAFQLQPSELAKIACVLLVSAVSVEWMRGKVPAKTYLGRVGLATVVPAGLVLAQPDLGTTLTLVVAVMMVLLLAGIDWKWVAAVLGSVAVLAVVAIMIEPYRVKRFLAFLDPWGDAQNKGYQIVQALLAFGTGGVDGVGLGLSRQKFFYLPEAHNDFILAIIGEEMGLIGALSVVIGVALFVWAGFRIAIGARDSYGRLVAGGLTGMLGFQAVLNMAAVTGLMPVTGKPLPFVSYGGSSILVTMICLGLILSVSEYGACAPRAVKQRKKSGGPRGESSDERRRDRGPRPSRVDGGGAVRRRA